MQVVLDIIVVLTIIVLILRQFLKSLPSELSIRERKELFWMVILGIGFKFGVVLGWYFLREHNLDAVWKDTYIYEEGGWYLATQFKDFVFYRPGFEKIYGFYPGYYYFVGIIYALFGHYGWMVSIFNTLTTIVFALLTYFIAYQIFDGRVARLALIFNLFFPNYIPFSFYILKDAVTVFLVVSIGWGVFKAMKVKNPFYWLISLLFSVLLYFFRPHLAVVVVGVCGLHSIFSGFKRGGFLKSLLTVATILVTLIYLGGYIQPGGRSTFERIREIRLGTSGYGGEQLPPFLEGAQGFSEIFSRIISNPEGFIKYSVKETTLALFGPTYFYARSGPALFYKYGRFVFWDNLTALFKFFLLPPILYGFLYLIRKKKRDIFLIYGFPIIWALGLYFNPDWFRWYMPAMPFVLIIGALGWTKFDKIKPFYIPYLLLLNLLVIANATLYDSLIVVKPLALFTFGGIGWVLYRHRGHLFGRKR